LAKADCICIAADLQQHLADTRRIEIADVCFFAVKYFSFIIQSARNNFKEL
jgi:hypothetical protein